MKKVEAVADYKLLCRCPNCDEGIDLLDQDNGYDQNNESTEAFFGDWKNPEISVVCHVCETEFSISQISY